MQLITVSDVPSQTLVVQVGGQNCSLSVYQRSTSGVDTNGNPTSVGLFMDVEVEGEPVITGVLCENLNRIVRDPYLGFIGDFAWWDTQGSPLAGLDPSTPGLGSRYQLLYMEADDVAGF